MSPLLANFLLEHLLLGGALVLIWARPEEPVWTIPPRREVGEYYRLEAPGDMGLTRVPVYRRDPVALASFLVCSAWLLLLTLLLAGFFSTLVYNLKELPTWTTAISLPSSVPACSLPAPSSPQGCSELGWCAHMARHSTLSG